MRLGLLALCLTSASACIAQDASDRDVGICTEPSRSWTGERLPLEYVKAFGDVQPDQAGTQPFHAAHCEGTYPHHLQGICTNEKDAIYWSFTTALVKTDKRGKVLKKIRVANHHGDLCFHAGTIYVAVNLGRFNDPNGNADSWVYLYDADDLSLLKKHEVQQVFHGAGGIGFCDGRFVVVGGLPKGVNENYVYEYDRDFHFVKRHVVNSGQTLLGIQTAAFADGHWWFGCYGNPRVMVKADKSFKFLGKYEFDCALGIVGLSKGRFLVARGSCQPGTGCRGSVQTAYADSKKGLVLKTVTL